MKVIPVLYNCPLLVLINWPKDPLYFVIWTTGTEANLEVQLRQGTKFIFSAENAVRIKLFADDATSSERDLDLLAEANWKKKSVNFF